MVHNETSRSCCLSTICVHNAPFHTTLVFLIANTANNGHVAAASNGTLVLQLRMLLLEFSLVSYGTLTRVEC